VNLGVDLAPSKARSAADDGNVDVSNPDGQGCHLIIDPTVNAGGLGSIQVTIQGKDPLSGKKYTILQSAVLTALATVVLRVGAGLPVSANLSANDVLPKDLSINFVHGAGGPITYTARLELIGSH
jgi:hypothetical protein